MKIAIIGAGAAGMMAAATLAEQTLSDTEIYLFDKNLKIGVKVALTGGGRCNITTSITERKVLFSKYTRGAEFLKHSFEEFGPRKVFSWFQEHGLPLYAQDDNRVFPRSDQGSDVIEAFEVIFKKHAIRMKLGEGVVSLRKESDGFHLTSDRAEYIFDVVMLATGGNAYAHTGSSGDGYSLARSLGHTITPLGPSLNSFETRETWCHDLSGIAFQNARLTSNCSNGTKIDVMGPLLFTHFGISGPVTFSLSSHLAFERIDTDNPAETRLSIDGQKDYQAWDAELRTSLEKEPSRLVKNILARHLPSRFADSILDNLGIDKEVTAAHFSKEQRKLLVHALTGQTKITLIKRRPGDEFVTAGGVNLSEVDQKTLQSKLLPGLFFGGEVLDIDGVTGGFNLQSAWATGRVAGLSIANMLKTI